MAGYGFRPGPMAPKNPYAVTMGGCEGMYDRPAVKAIVLDNGQERIAILRLPTSWSTDFLRTAIAKELADRTGTSWEGRIVTVSTHTHSYPARYWKLLPGRGFEAFGYGGFSATWWRHLVETSVDAVEAAVEGLRPAALGWSLERDFDPDNHINRDRRGENPPFKDPRMLVIRVDDVSGDEPAPMAVLVEFAMHGTIMEEPMLSGDSGGGVEMVLQETLEARYGREVTVMFANGNAGDVSPDGDDLGHPGIPRLEVLGHRTAGWVVPMLEAMEPVRELTLRQVDRRVPITREAIGYAPGEFYREPRGSWDQDAGPFRYGAFQCVQDGDDDPETKHEDGHLGCMFSVELMNNDAPVLQFSKTVVTALRIGDLVVLTLPGESVSQLGEDLALAVEARYGVESVSVWGYAQDHQLYLTPMDDWLQGGYEAAQGVWGFRFGEYLAREAEEAAGAVLDGAEFTPPPEGIKPVWYDELEDDSVPPQVTDGVPGEVQQDVPEQVTRYDLVRFGWTGGFPGVDLPDVVLEAQAGDGSFAPLVWPGARPYTDRNFRMVLTYDGKWRTEHTWWIAWEELADFPAGTYRLRVAGRHWTGEAAEEYEATSRAFEVLPRIMEIAGAQWARDEGRFSGAVSYPPAVEGSYRMRSALARHPSGGAPAEDGVTVTAAALDAGGAEVPLQVAPTYDASDPAALSVTLSTPAGGEAPEQLVVTVADAHGNTWSWTSGTE